MGVLIEPVGQMHLNCYVEVSFSSLEVYFELLRPFSKRHAFRWSKNPYHLQHRIQLSILMLRVHQQPLSALSLLGSNF